MRRSTLRTLWFVSFLALGCEGSCHHVDVAAQAKIDVKRTKSKPPRIPLGLNLGSLNYYAPTLPFVDVMKNADDPQTTNAEFGGPWNTCAAEGAGKPRYKIRPALVGHQF